MRYLRDVPRRESASRPRAPFLIGIRQESGETDYLRGGSGGWFYFSRTGAEGDVWIRFEAERRRIVVAELHLVGVSAAGLRELALGKLEKIVNSPDLAPIVRAFASAPAPALTEPGESFVATLRKMAPALSGPAGLGFLPRPDPFIDVPPDRKRPDQFYAEVARTYAALAGWTRHPAQEIAEESGVPVTTVQRWMKEARRRGLTPAGQRSREE